MVRQLLPLSALLAASLLLVFGNGAAGLLLPTRAALEGWSTDTIALMGAAYALAFTAGCIGVPRLVARVGHIRVYSALGTLLIMSMLMHAMEVTPWFWVVVRALAGFSVAGSYMIVESWLNEEVTNETRGTIFSVYMVSTLIGQSVGPFLVTLGAPGDFTLFAWCAIIYAVSTLPILLTSARSPQPLTRFSLDLRGLYANSPAAAVGSLMSGAIVGLWLNLVPVYGIERGFASAAIATLLAAGNIGSMLFQLPVGRLSDRIDRRLVMVGLGIVGAALSVAIALFGDDPTVLAVLAFALGAALYTPYSINVAHANDWARDVSFVTVASGLLVLYGIGSTIAPLIGARVMAWAGPGGLFATIAVFYLAYAGFALWRVFQRPELPREEQEGFRSIPVGRVATPQTFEFDTRSDAEAEPDADTGTDYDAPNPIWGYEYHPPSATDAPPDGDAAPNAEVGAKGDARGGTDGTPRARG